MFNKSNLNNADKTKFSKKISQHQRQKAKGEKENI